MNIFDYIIIAAIIACIAAAAIFVFKAKRKGKCIGCGGCCGNCGGCSKSSK